MLTSGKEYSGVTDPAAESPQFNLTACIFHCLEKRDACKWVAVTHLPLSMQKTNLQLGLRTGYMVGGTEHKWWVVDEQVVEQSSLVVSHIVPDDNIPGVLLLHHVFFVQECDEKGLCCRDQGFNGDGRRLAG